MQKFKRFIKKLKIAASGQIPPEQSIYFNELYYKDTKKNVNTTIDCKHFVGFL